MPRLVAERQSLHPPEKAPREMPIRGADDGGDEDEKCQEREPAPHDTNSLERIEQQPGDECIGHVCKLPAEEA